MAPTISEASRLLGKLNTAFGSLHCEGTWPSAGFYWTADDRLYRLGDSPLGGIRLLPDGLCVALANADPPGPPGPTNMEVYHASNTLSMSISTIIRAARPSRKGRPGLPLAEVVRCLKALVAKCGGLDTLMTALMKAPAVVPKTTIDFFADDLAEVVAGRHYDHIGNVLQSEGHYSPSDDQHVSALCQVLGSSVSEAYDSLASGRSGGMLILPADVNGDRQFGCRPRGRYQGDVAAFKDLHDRVRRNVLWRCDGACVSL